MTDEPNPLAPVREAADCEPRKAHYGNGEQPWDVILASGWGPAFAAANVVKYLRRTKNPEHSLESARWYYARLYENAAEETMESSSTPWSSAIARLELILSTDEIALVRGAT